VKIGIVGCGNISSAYLRTAQLMKALKTVACADIYMDRAKAKAEEFEVPKACTVEELMADPDIQIVVNLTTPQAHFDITMQALRAGKHVYNEKPLAVTREDGRKILDTAKRKKLRVGCAPGTFIGGGLQTCRKMIDEGAIGDVVGCSAFMMCHGHEGWHPDPAYYYKVGAGPMFDMGPYYLTALTTLLGPIKRLTGCSAILIPKRTITSQPKYGEKIKVETPDHVTGSFEFASGAVGVIITTFAVWSSQLPRIEIYGTEGTLAVPDPNSLGGPVRIRPASSGEWQDVTLTHGHSDGGKWGIGVADMAHAILSGRPHRATGEQAFHVLDLMHGFLDASRDGKHYSPVSKMQRPAPVPTGLADNTLDD